MTDEKIITALNCCYGFHCEKCPLKGDDHCGLTLEDESIKLIERLKAEIESLKAEIKKPVCMPGDKVYQFSDGEVYESTVQQIIYDCGHIAFAEAAIGKQVFLTKEEAEKAVVDNGVMLPDEK